MEKKVLLKELVDSGTNIRREFIPKAVVSTEGEYQIGEFWDANKTIDVIVNNAHKQHDNIREIDEYTHNIDAKKVSRVIISSIDDLSKSQIGQLKVGDVIIVDDGISSKAYVTSDKTNDSVTFVHTDSDSITKITYQKTNDEWQHSQPDVFDVQDYYKKDEIDQIVQELEEQASSDEYLHEFMSQAAYESLTTIDPNTIYFIVDDGDVLPAQFPIKLS